MLLGAGIFLAVAITETQTKDFVGSSPKIECIIPSLDFSITGVTYTPWDVQAPVVPIIDLPAKVLEGFLTVEEKPPAEIGQRC